VSVVSLVLRGPLESSVEVDGLTADRFATLNALEIAELPVWIGSRGARLGDFFDVRGERSASVRVEGDAHDLAHVDGLGAGMAGGELTIDGGAGHRVGAGMSGGRVHVRGNAGDEAGLAMSGGVLRIGGNVGDRAGAGVAGASRGMTGGELLVDGSAGAEAAAHLRRGLVVVGGDVGAHAARTMIAGTLIVFGDVASPVARANKRGTVIAARHVNVPPTYRYACTFEPPHVRLTMTYLRRRHGLAIDSRLVEGRYHRYCGDAGRPGKGEILQWVAQRQRAF